MSSQPSSTLDQVKDKASNVYDSVSNTVSSTEQKANPSENYNGDKHPASFKKDFHGNVVQKGDFKDKLNEAALRGPEEPKESFVEKALSYVPGVKELQKQVYGQGEPEKEKLGGKGPPNRPDHDVQVEEFLRTQYHSKSGEGMPNPAGAEK